MIVDNSLTFAARRNIPVRYNRDLVATTIKAMERVSEIRARRERLFYKKRMAGNKERERAANRKLVAENEHLLPKVRASDKIAMEVEKPLLEDRKSAEDVLNPLDQPIARKRKVKRRLLVGGGVEERMDVE